MRKNKNKILLFALTVVFVFLLPLFGRAVSSAEQVQNQTLNSPQSEEANPNSDDISEKVENNTLVSCSLSECTFCHLLKLFERIFFWVLALSFATAILFAVASGYIYIFSTGDSGSINWAKDGFKYALVGFVICISSWLVIHAVYVVLGYKGNWWQMECVNEIPGLSDQKVLSASELYKNEVTPNSQGGRDNPITLPDLAVTGIKNLPMNKYFFIHGLGGQPLDNAAKQIAQIVEEVKREKKFVYAVTPLRNVESGEIEGSKLINLINFAGANLKETQKKVKTVITGLIADSPSGTNFPLLIADSEQNLKSFNNVWPETVGVNKALKTIHNGIVYEEGGSYKKGDEETLFFINLVSDLSRRQAGNPDNLEKEKFYLNRENPLSFNLPPDISPNAAKQMTVDIAQVVAESVKSSESLNKDQWTQILGLMYKDFATKENKNGESVYSPATFASYAVKTPGQITDPVKLKEVEKELDKIAKDIIDRELQNNNNSNNNQSETKTSSTNKNNVLSDAEKIFESIQDYFFYPFSNTPVLDNLIASERKIVKNNNYQSGVNVNRVPNLDPANLSKIGGRITTDNMLSLEEREAIRNLIIDIQKEMEDNSGIEFKIPPDLIMCIFEKESKFDPGAMSQTGCSGLGQLSMGAARSATKKLKKLAPRHFEALAEKIQKEFGVDMAEVLTRDGGNDKKREILRSDPNLNAVLAFVHLTEKGIVGKGGSVRNSQDLRNMVNGYGPGNYSYASSILNCLENGSWKIISEKIQAIIEAREAKNK